MPVLDISNMTDEQLRQAAQSLASLGGPEQMGQLFPGLGGPNVGQQLQPQQSPLIPGGAGGIPPGAVLPPQGPQSPIPPQNFPIQAAPQQAQAQEPDIGKILAAMSAVRPVQPPEVVNPPSGGVNVGNASLAQALIPGLYRGGVGRPLPVRLTG